MKKYILSFCFPCLSTFAIFTSPPIEEHKKNARTSIRILDLSQNKLTNELLAKLNIFTKLDTLSLNHRAINQPMIHQLIKTLSIREQSNNKNNKPTPFTPIKSLNIKNNLLTSIPPEIGKLTQLTHLDLSVNSLMSVPRTIGQLYNLESLNLNHNQLTSIPK